MIPWLAMDVGPLLVGLTCAAALVTGFLRDAVGGGIGLALTPVLALVLPPQLTSAGIVATDTLAYAISDVVKVGTYAAIGWVTPPLLLTTLAATPLLFLGSWLGYRLNARLPRQAFALTLVAIALTGALRLLLS